MYRRKQLEVEALQYDGFNFEEISKFTNGSCHSEVIRHKVRYDSGFTVPEWVEINLVTDNGPVRIRPLDYILKDSDGRYYGCSPDVFRRDFERVEGQS